MRTSPGRLGARVAALIVVLAATLPLGACGRERAPAAAPPELLVFAAASLQDALGELEAPFAAAGGRPLAFNFAGSNVLAQQLAAAPLADVFVSADELWVDFLERQGRLEPGTRRPILGNRLVVVGRDGSGLRLSGVADLAHAPFEHLALGDPDGVPAGRYARRWLRSVRVDPPGADLWSLVEDRVLPAPDVRAALGLVASHPGVIGIVYRSDLGAARGVRALLEAGAGDGPTIRYVAAAIGGRPEPAAARRLLDFLRGPTAREVFARHGFTPLPV